MNRRFVISAVSKVVLAGASKGDEGQASHALEARYGMQIVETRSMNWLFAVVMKLIPSRRPLPLSVVYPFVGAILALALAAGLLALRLLASDAPSLVDELRAGTLVY